MVSTILFYFDNNKIGDSNVHTLVEIIIVFFIFRNAARYDDQEEVVSTILF